MKTMRSLLLPILLLPVLWLIAPDLSAQDRSPDKVKERMAANLPALDALRKEGKVGETNKGYLEARASLSDKEKALVKTENEDRKSVYQLLAERTQTTLERIEQARAEQIRRRAAKGVWLQNPAGEWYQKNG
jgi:hypothetical protein